MTQSRTPTWLVLLVAVPGVLVVAVAGLWVFMWSTATPVHPLGEAVAGVAAAAPGAAWVGAVEAGRGMVRASVAEENLPGVSVAVGVGGEIVWAEGFGFADVEGRVGMTPKHRLRIGTASTVLTSAAVGLLVERGQLKLDDAIGKWVPAYGAKQWPVTLRQVMGHVAGVKSDGGDEGPLFGQHCSRPVEALQYLGEGGLLFEPGTEFRFSRYGWILVSAAVEAAAGRPFLQFMRKEVFEPLGMRDTVADTVADSATAGMVTPYFPRFAADPGYGLDVMRELDLSCYAGASVFVSTPSDLVRFGMGIGGGKLLQRGTVELLQAPQRLRSGQETGYGLGWDLRTETVAGHDGDVLGGMVASLLTLPQQGVVVAVVSNTSYAPTHALAVKLAHAFAGGAASR